MIERSGAGAPRVTIGLPVYNGENYLEAAVQSILAQTFDDFELIISDNASTDRTEAICRSFADQDHRVTYLRQPQNLGAAPNYNLLFHQARGEYFKWAAHDDVVHPEFLGKAVEVLDRHPEVPLVYSKTRKIDERGEVVGSYGRYDDRIRIDAPHPHIRFGDVVCVQHNSVALFGLMRKSQLASTDLHGAYPGGDRTLLGEMALRGPLYQIPEYLFYRRDHPGAYSHRQNRTWNRIDWWDAGKGRTLTLPNWRRLTEYRAAIRRASLPLPERLGCYVQLARWLVGPTWYRQRWVHLFGDLVRASWWGMSKLRLRNRQMPTDA